ncbi:hypothetical protein MKW98_009843 [Papaver atlanticum]|uniref:Uncharacterized protein n=1 Tax=Papaver atlanticum TaxID=357466 RepID=A0AAD4S7Q5_9MAGN|nr:hypothetical protein MKW98_004889 [Papaver atlanticum]KAI3926827.1 hypothetical protein MKW98_009843 [Papaver atlanticum]
MTTARSYSDDEPQWLIHSEIPVCIYNVPKVLMFYKPESYIPQHVSIGPYHYMRPECYQMSRHKVAAARRIQKHLNVNILNNNTSSSSSAYLKFEHLVQQSLIKLDRKIRSCYKGYIELKPDVLAWIMAADASFLVSNIYDNNNKVELSSSISRVIKSFTRSSSYLFVKNHSWVGLGRKSAHNVILKDIMIEQLSSLETADEVLRSMLIGIFKETSPIIISEECFLNINPVEGYAHLLDFLYQMLVPHSIIQQDKGDQVHDHQISVPDNHDHDIEDDNDAKADSDDNNKESFGNTSHVKQFGNERAIVSKPVILVAKLPWTVISRVPGFGILAEPIKNFIFSHEEDKEKIKPDESKPPTIEEINIPSISQLYKSAGIRFVPTNGNIESVRFDEKSATIHLPILDLDVNSEVVLRNLVAYESSNASGPLVFARYTELMNGIIDTGEDAMLLRPSGIVFNHFKSDQEVAKLWNGMCKSIRLTKVPFLDKMIEDVNKYYSRRWKVKAKKIIKTYILGSWQFLTFLAAFLLLMMTAFQAFCSVYNCSRLLRIPVVDQLAGPTE